jgi:hypothetical protein
MCVIVSICDLGDNREYLDSLLFWVPLALDFVDDFDVICAFAITRDESVL